MMAKKLLWFALGFILAVAVIYVGAQWLIQGYTWP